MSEASPAGSGSGAEQPGPAGPVIRVVLPAHLRTLAGVSGEVVLDLAGRTATQASLIDALEQRFPNLGGTVRDRATGRRRPFVRFFAGEEDLSHDDPTTPLPDAVTAGAEIFFVVGAMAGGLTPAP